MKEWLERFRMVEPVLAMAAVVASRNAPGATAEADGEGGVVAVMSTSEAHLRAIARALKSLPAGRYATGVIMTGMGDDGARHGGDA